MNDVSPNVFFGGALAKKRRLELEALEKEYGPEDFIIPLTNATDGLPIYCFPTISLDPDDFGALARFLPEHRLFSFRVPPEGADTSFGSSVESIAKWCVDKIVKFQPEGALAALGASAGVGIEYEVGQQLKARGREVRFLAAIDFAPSNTPAYDTYWWKFYLSFWQAYYKSAGQIRLKRDMATRSWEEIRENGLKSFFTKASETLTKIRKEKMARQEQKGNQTPSRLPEHLASKFANLPEFHLKLMGDFYAAGINYKPKPYDGRVIVYIASLQPSKCFQDLKRVWSSIARKVEFVDVEGGHVEIIGSRTVAEHLRQVLNENRPSAPEPEASSAARSQLVRTEQRFG
jgi:thioesterase domain-containing protein